MGQHFKSKHEDRCPYVCIDKNRRSSGDLGVAVAPCIKRPSPVIEQYYYVLEKSQSKGQNSEDVTGVTPCLTPSKEIRMAKSIGRDVERWQKMLQADPTALTPRFPWPTW
nr:hypothetical protein Iba_chr12aCG19810 [Ipomoea batatas]GMD73476.1 hypothetical protein Iba_chr12fCG18730 [Ipomoea batatas]